MDYVVASIQRSGSGLLRDYLRATDIAGNPTEHVGGRALEASRLYRKYGLDTHIDNIQRTPNDVRGCKLNYHHLVRIGPKERQIIEQKLVVPSKIIFLTREDKVGQAVSSAIARQTQSWISHKQPSCEPVFGFDLIEREYNEIIEGNKEWEHLFKKYNKTPLRITYEQIVADPVTTVNNILTFLGLEEVQPNVILETQTREKQGNATNKQWIDKYNKMLVEQKNK